MTTDKPGADLWPILVVEDHPATRRLLEMHLRKADYQALTVSNGQEALHSLERHFCPLVITDWMMPEMDGLALCRAIRERNWEGYVYVILLTAKDAQDDIIQGLGPEPTTTLPSRCIRPSSWPG